MCSSTVSAAADGIEWVRKALHRRGNIRSRQTNTSHAYGCSEEDPWTIYWVHFQGEHAAVYAVGAQQPQRVTPNMQSRISHRNSVFEEIFTTLSRDNSIDALRFVSSLLHYYLASMRYLQQYRQAEPPEPKAADDDAIVEAAIHFLNENIGQRLSLSDMAAYVGYSV